MKARGTGLVGVRTTAGPRRSAFTLFFCIFSAFVGGAVAAQDLTGTWAYRGPADSGLWLKTAQTGGAVRFELEISRGGPSYNSGWITGEFEALNGMGEFRQATEDGVCEIRFHFHSTRVELTQVGDHSACGFGHGVTAVGVLRRTSRKPPTFCVGDPRSGGCNAAAS